LLNGVILPDFIDLAKRKIIEFDGTYYHRLTPENSLREEKRDKMINESGYEVLHISEIEYKNNKQKIIDKCIAFLNKK
jgi:very-short-patch-repair endonuclease